MSGKDTRERILHAAIILFNDHGLANVRLQNIADECDISVGNLAYHYNGKNLIIEKISFLIREELEHIFGNWHSHHMLIDFDNQLNKLYHILIKYSFYFSDILEIKRLFPREYKLQKEVIQLFIHELHQWLLNSEEKGLLQKKDENFYLQQAEMIWFISCFWTSGRKILGASKFQERGFKENIWQQINFYLTDEGKQEFEILIFPGLYI